MAVEHTLLLTDLVDSTALSAALGNARAAALWESHDRVARDLLVTHRGREIDKSDGFLLLFDQLSDGLAYASDYHRAIASLGLKARAGIHRAEVTLRETPAADVSRGAKPLEVDGLGKSVAARVMSVASGGQTLATREAAPKSAMSHGTWRLKGLLDPIELFEVTGDGVPPPDGPKAWRVHRVNEVWVPVREVPRHLPAERDGFVGRLSDLRSLADALDGGARLVSVLGVGGGGKTRLVVRYAWSWLGEWPGGVWFCDLSEARDLDGLVTAVARALGHPLSAEEGVAQLGRVLASRGRCLVILDNFEQVARHAPATVGVWLDRAAEVQFVATTREVLGIPGEVALALAPLDPTDSVELFHARAVQARRDYVPTEADRDAVRELVRLLDGLPLAIELAAARVRVMGPGALLQRMSERFRLLASGGGRTTRQSTLRATLDWSYDLLSPAERNALAQLSVFSGGFSLAAAEDVLSVGDHWVVDLVQALVDKSLVRRIGPDRFDLLVSVLEYADEKLGADRGAVEVRHGAWFAGAFADSAGSVGAQRAAALATDRDNLLAACRRAVSRGDAVVAFATVRLVWEVLQRQGPATGILELVAQVEAVPGLSAAARGQLAYYASHALRLLGRFDEARVRAEQALAAAREAGDRRAEGIALGGLGVLATRSGRRDQALAHYEAALGIHLEVGDPTAECAVRDNLGILYLERGRLDEARRHFQAALVVAREHGNVRAEALVLGNLANLESTAGAQQAAQARYESALSLARRAGDKRNEGVVLGNLGSLYMHFGRSAEARSALEAALAIHREVGDRRMQASVHRNLGELHRDERRTAESFASLGAALDLFRELGDPRSEGTVLGSLAATELEAGRPEAARERLGVAEGLLKEAGDPLRLGLILTVRARVEHHIGDAVAARAALDGARELAAAAGAGPDSDLGLAIGSAATELDRAGAP